jgi:hypothetical protein
MTPRRVPQPTRLQGSLLKLSQSAKAEINFDGDNQIEDPAEMTFIFPRCAESSMVQETSVSQMSVGWTTPQAFSRAIPFYISSIEVCILGQN